MRDSLDSFRAPDVNKERAIVTGSRMAELALFDAQPELPFRAQDETNPIIDEDSNMSAQDELQYDTKESR